MRDLRSQKPVYAMSQEGATDWPESPDVECPPESASKHGVKRDLSVLTVAAGIAFCMLLGNTELR
jgi:hypothetical protein